MPDTGERNEQCSASLSALITEGLIMEGRSPATWHMLLHQGMAGCPQVVLRVSSGFF